MMDGFATEALASDEQPGGQPGLNTNVIVGIVAAVVGVSVGLLGALGFYFWRRRNNRAGTLRRSNNVEGGTAFSQSAGAQDGEFVSMFLHDYAEVKPLPIRQQRSRTFPHSSGSRVAPLPSMEVSERMEGRMGQQLVHLRGARNQALHHHTQGRSDHTTTSCPNLERIRVVPGTTGVLRRTIREGRIEFTVKSSTICCASQERELLWNEMKYFIPWRALHPAPQPVRVSLTLCRCLNSAGQCYPCLLFVQYTHRETGQTTARSSNS